MRHAVRALLAVASVAVVLLAAEGLLRLWPAPGADLRGIHRAEPGAPWLYDLRPGASARIGGPTGVLYEVNADGYRGPAVPRARSAGTVRILVLGDSVAFGYGVNEAESFPRRLEAAAPGLEVLNFGVGGYNPYNESMLLRGRGLAYEPDVVLVQFCVNDLNEPTAHFDRQTRGALARVPDAAFPDLRERGHADARASCAADPCRCSKVCSATRRAWRRLARPDAPEPIDPAVLEPRGLPPGPSRRWLGERYAEMAAGASAIGARFAVVVFPYRAQLGEGADGLQRQILRLGRERGFVVIDLLPGFRAAEAEGALFLDPWHPTPRGHAIAADAIAARLRDLGWIPVTSGAGQ